MGALLHVDQGPTARLPRADTNSRHLQGENRRLVPNLSGYGQVQDSGRDCTH